MTQVMSFRELLACSTKQCETKFWRKKKKYTHLWVLNWPACSSKYSPILNKKCSSGQFEFQNAFSPEFQNSMLIIYCNMTPYLFFLLTPQLVSKCKSLSFYICGVHFVILFKYGAPLFYTKLNPFSSLVHKCAMIIWALTRINWFSRLPKDNMSLYLN